MNSILRAGQRTYSEYASVTMMRPALDNHTVVREYQPYFPSGGPLGASS